MWYTDTGLLSKLMALRKTVTTELQCVNCGVTTAFREVIEWALACVISEIKTKQKQRNISSCVKIMFTVTVYIQLVSKGMIKVNPLPVYDICVP